MKVNNVVFYKDQDIHIFCKSIRCTTGSWDLFCKKRERKGIRRCPGCIISDNFMRKDYLVYNTNMFLKLGTVLLLKDESIL